MERTMDTLNRIISQSLKRKSVISELRKKYGGKWVYHHKEYLWEHVGNGYVRNVAILGGFNGDDLVGSELIYYPKNGRPERLF
jgi:hypothetical protein